MLLQFLYLTLVFHYVQPSDTPIVGVLAQEAYLVQNAYPDADSFISASTVKFLESSGARVLPIWINQDAAYYERVVQYTNGVLFPGGGTYFNESGGYGDAAKLIYKLAIKANDVEGVHYPLFGVCLGMQVLAFAATDGTDVRKDCSAKNVALPLEFVEGYKESKLFFNASSRLLENLQTENLTFNNHMFCLFEDVMEANNLSDWRILSKNKDVNGTEFVSTMENTKYPFYGVQYHPEQIPFEFKKSSVPHSADAMEFSQYLGNFFLGECRKNNHTFPSPYVELSALIYNYNPVYSVTNTSYEQLYLFTPDDYAKNLLI